MPEESEDEEVEEEDELEEEEEEDEDDEEDEEEEDDEEDDLEEADLARFLFFFISFGSLWTGEADDDEEEDEARLFFFVFGRDLACIAASSEQDIGSFSIVSTNRYKYVIVHLTKKC